MSKAKSTARAVALKHGFRSGLEDSTASNLNDRDVRFTYETHKISWVDYKVRSYTPDFILDNNIIVETKGRFVAEDRRKHLAIKEQYPDLDIRFVFSNANARLSKRSKTTYAMWCRKNGFKWAHKSIPEDWPEEVPKSLEGLEEKKKK